MQRNELYRQYISGRRDYRHEDFRGAYLSGMVFSGMDFSCADLTGADLTDVDFEDADLSGADFTGADLTDADLTGADLTDAVLRCADLTGADLTDADLTDADLTGTCLDPIRPPNGNVEGFALIDGGQWAIGYRTRHSLYFGNAIYTVGNIYEAPAFSVSPRESHPGIYVYPTKQAVIDWCVLSDIDPDVVKVIFRPWEAHCAGDKCRVRWLIVWATA